MKADLNMCGNISYVRMLASSIMNMLVLPEGSYVIDASAAMLTHTHRTHQLLSPQPHYPALWGLWKGCKSHCTEC